MVSYRQAVEALQPVIPQLFDAVSEGLEHAVRYHADEEYQRQDDAHFFPTVARRKVLDRLYRAGLIARHPKGDRPLLSMSGLLVPYENVVIWVRKMRKVRSDPVEHEIPLPQSRRQRQFWRQEPVLDLPGLPTDNLLLLWSEDHGVLDPAMTLVRPLGGDHRRDNLRYEWAGPLRREMATFSAADLDELRPAPRQSTLWEEDTG
ncbi:hypothetical protein SAMN05421810_103444 [Amycolatopsis arida]|uniref:Uncharacterized protein n=1 Tax=Amycolatopsis arida TaxID=587909 RepID=A0A1I5TA72_9PSEU|nr:hypothetical protein [Amycolatopsis arida]TDX96177.1 hypothetical protein CLV69_103314 [Amycolatopsis arida]SFP79567.1 hypothetical protein SAMN05421810_103444 [Amycolatopsis arida]